MSDEIRTLKRAALVWAGLAVATTSVFVAFYVLQIRPKMIPRPTAEEIKELRRSIDAVTDVKDLQTRLKGTLVLGSEKDQIYLDMLDLFVRVIAIGAVLVASGFWFFFLKLGRYERSARSNIPRGDL